MTPELILAIGIGLHFVCAIAVFLRDDCPEACNCEDCGQRPCECSGPIHKIHHPSTKNTKETLCQK